MGAEVKWVEFQNGNRDLLRTSNMMAALSNDFANRMGRSLGIFHLSNRPDPPTLAELPSIQAVTIGSELRIANEPARTYLNTDISKVQKVAFPG